MPGPSTGPLSAGRRADRLDRRRIRLEVAVGIGHRPRRLPEHVERMRIALRAIVFGPLERFGNRPAHDELPAQDPHRLNQRLADHRLAAAADQTAENTQ